jgi:hypothetical protein
MLMRELAGRGLVEPPDPNAPGQFAWSRRETIAEHLEAAGFVEHVIERIEFEQRFGSIEQWWEMQSGLSAAATAAAARMDEATLADVLAALRAGAARFTAPDGSLTIPAATWVAAATA